MSPATAPAPRRRQRTDVIIRRALPEDEDALATFIACLSPAARQRRFLGPVTPRGAARGLMRRSTGVVAVAPSGGRIVGHACFVNRAGGRAEIGVAVLDAWQRQGIGEQLLRALAAIAAERDIRRLVARLGEANEGLVEALSDAGVPLTVRRDADLLVVEAPVELDAGDAAPMSEPASRT